ncbi:MAG: sugar ABC transporter permease [Burkholderiales bacterium]|nr:sugar ABC transporter permease [Anaerolineae bacterium]
MTIETAVHHHKSADERALITRQRKPFLQSYAPYLYLAPALIFIAIFVFYPLARTVQISFFEWNIIRDHQTYVGLENYLHLLRDDDFWQIIKQSIMYLTISVGAVVALPVSLAFLTLQLTDKEIDFYQSVLFFPTVIATSVAVLVWIWFFLPTRSGLFNTVLQPFGIETIEWLTNSFTALPAVAIVANWKVMGFHFLIALAGLKAIPRDYIEAAYVDGASGWALMRQVILPLFAPTALFLLIITLIQGLEYVFVPIRVMTLGGPANASNNLMYAVYQEGFQNFRAGYASALSVMLIVLFGGLAFIQYRVLDRRVQYER